MRRKIAGLVLAGALGAGLVTAGGVVAQTGSASGEHKHASRSERKAAQKAAYAPAGKAVDCVQLTDIRETNVLDDSTIDFKMRNGKVYRNTLPASCPQLGFEERFSYKTSISRLCSLDTITVLPVGSPIQGPTCGLGKFQPMEKVANR